MVTLPQAMRGLMGIAHRMRHGGGIAVLGIAALLSSHLRDAQAGVRLGKVRVIYSADHPDATLTVSNTGTDPEIIQTWVESADATLDTPLFAAPPLFRLDPGDTNLIRVTLVGHAPDTRVERLYWLNVKEIPPAPPKSATNTLQFAIRSRIKLLYRPPGLDASLNPLHDLKYGQDHNSVENTSSYVASLLFTCRGSDQPQPLTLNPHASLPMPRMPCSPADIRIQSINDYGGISQKLVLSPDGTKPATD